MAGADPTTRYARAVVAGRTVAGPWVRLAARRHLDDLGPEGRARGLRFDRRAAAHALAFFPFLTLAEGDHAGKPFALEPAQEFIVGSLFGWRGADGDRRFRVAYVEMGKGGGKTPLAAGIGLYGLLADGEAGAEIYSAAVTRDQASICYKDAVKMVQASPALAERIEVMATGLYHRESGSLFRPVSSEARALDGKRVHMAIIDEVHEHRTPLVVDKMRAGTKGRRNPLILQITNAGYDRKSVCWAQHEYSCRVVEGAVRNDAWFAYVCALDEGDDWADEGVWIKANPLLDVAITRKYLREQVEEARGMPHKEGIVRRLNCCEWTEQATRWLPPELWEACPGTPAADAEARGAVDALAARLAGRPCWGGLDLARVRDLSSLALAFAPEEEGGPWSLLWWNWLPADDLKRRVEQDGVPYDAWERAGWLITTPGNVTDFSFIRAAILALAGRYEIRELAYDPFSAGELVQELLAEGVPMVEHRQGYLSMAAPTAEFERLVRGGLLRHAGNPLARWASRNVAVRTDPAGNLKPDKEHSFERIDPIVAAIMAIGRGTAGAAQPRSVYADRGLLVLGGAPPDEDAEEAPR